MHLTTLKIENFKNYRLRELMFDLQSNVIVGPNGTGKTTILDAIHVLSMTKSFLNSLDSQLIYEGEEYYAIEGKFKYKEEKNVRVYFSKNGKKIIKVNDLVQDKISDHIGKIPLVIISPEDNRLIFEGSDWRRKFMDATISQWNKKYLQALISYNSFLKQRNALLKNISGNASASMLEVFNFKMDKEAEYIFTERVNFMHEIQPQFDLFHKQISGQQESVQLIYDHNRERQTYLEMWENSIEQDLRLQYTTQGIHKEDLKLLIEQKPLKKYASQGQQKSFLLALKLAQYVYLKNKTGIYPVLLLDDIHDKIDEKRLFAFFEILNQNQFGQMFITDTHLDRIPEIFRKLGRNYSILHTERL
ncbi:MAG: DNA replication and repair protein RecF [Vicingaceae bacterium]|nr:MAG: DNA replication and repair protein RecF [Vicingaceae bacterium]